MTAVQNHSLFFLFLNCLKTEIFLKGTKSLLRILRHAKFSQIKARDTIEEILKFQFKHRYACENIDSRDPPIQEFIKRGYYELLIH